MKYLILIYNNPQTRQVWESMSEAERGVGWEAYAALDQELVKSGELVVSEALAGQEETRRIQGTVASDGPFAEVKEHLAGFYLVDCEGMDRAMEIAAMVPKGSYGALEVRPVVELG